MYTGLRAPTSSGACGPGMELHHVKGSLPFAPAVPSAPSPRALRSIVRQAGWNGGPEVLYPW